MRVDVAREGCATDDSDRGVEPSAWNGGLKGERHGARDGCGVCFEAV